MLLLATVALLMQTANAKQRASGPGSATFTAPDDAFRLSYPRDLQVCTKGEIQPCLLSYIPVCEEHALVCVIYPAEEFKDTSFGAASFQVREVFTRGGQMMTADICATPYPRDHGTTEQYPDFLISAKHPVQVIGGVQFIHGVKGGAAASHRIAIDLYRVFHGQRCFELSTSETDTNPMVSDPPMKTLTATQQKKLDETMSGILHSFRFKK